MASPDPVADVLMSAPPPLRAAAWDAFDQSKNEDDLAAKLSALPLSKDVKAKLWDMKHTAVPDAAPQPHEPTWVDRYPKTAQVVRGVTNALPAIGSLVGGALAAGPAAAASGTVVGLPAGVAIEAGGIGLGAGAGRGARDLVAEGLGLEPVTTPTHKALTIGADTAIAGGTAAALPGIVEAIKTPLRTSGELLEKTGGQLLPAKWTAAIKDLMSYTPNNPAAIMERPTWQTRGLPDVPKLHISSEAVLKIKSLVKQGISQEEAIQTVLKLAPRFANIAQP